MYVCTCSMNVSVTSFCARPIIIDQYTLHSYETLLVEERQASQEVMAFHRRMEAWAGSGAVHTTTSTATAAHSGKGRGGESATEMPPAVLAYEVCCVHSVHVAALPRKLSLGVGYSLTLDVCNWLKMTVCLGPNDSMHVRMYPVHDYE